jgi:hypothetical protein
METRAKGAIKHDRKYDDIINTRMKEKRTKTRGHKNTTNGEQTWNPELTKRRRSRAIGHERKLESIISNNIEDKRRRGKRCLKKNEHINKPKYQSPKSRVVPVIIYMK